MTDLEVKKTQAELLRVQAARAEMDYIIAQKQEEIDRLKGHMKIQDDKENELKQKLKESGK